jgi:hypothetical protein
MKNLIVGVDPGLRGAVVFYNLDTRRVEYMTKMPLKKRNARVKHEKTEIDLKDLAMVFQIVGPERVALAVIEQVSAMPKNGAVSMFTFGYVTGLITGVIGAHGIEIYKIRPSVWKHMIGLPKSKVMAIRRAKKLFGIDFDSDGLAEAALLAYIGANRLMRKA